MPAPPDPPKRLWISAGAAATNRLPGASSIRVATFNILAQIYATQQASPFCARASSLSISDDLAYFQHLISIQNMTRATAAAAGLPLLSQLGALLGQPSPQDLARYFRRKMRHHRAAGSSGPVNTYLALPSNLHLIARQLKHLPAGGAE
jgi:hypothetical protein